MVSVMVMVLVLTTGFGGAFGAGFGADTTLGEGEQIDWTHLSAASADRGILAICEALGQLTGSAIGLGLELLAGLATCFGAGFGAGFGFGGTGTVTVLVMV